MKVSGGIAMEQRRTRTEPVDFSAVEASSLGDAAFERRLLEVFLEDSDHHIAALEVALLAGRAEEAQREAHTLKGAAATLGAQDLEAVAARAEEAARGGRLEEAGSLLGELRRELLRVRTALEQRLLAHG